MATYYSVDPRGSAGIPGEVHTTKLNDLGAVREFSVDGVPMSFIYLSGLTSTATGEWVCFDPGTFTTTRLATTSKGQCAIATGAVDASTKWGWYGYVGSFAAFNLSATLSNNAVYASGTAGAGTSTLTKNCQVKKAVTRGAAPTTTGGATQATVIDRPFIGSYDESV
jgi:hypothetical protein